MLHFCFICVILSKHKNVQHINALVAQLDRVTGSLKVIGSSPFRRTTYKILETIDITWFQGFFIFLNCFKNIIFYDHLLFKNDHITVPFYYIIYVLYYIFSKCIFFAVFAYFCIFFLVTTTATTYFQRVIQPLHHL